MASLASHWAFLILVVLFRTDHRSGGIERIESG